MSYFLSRILVALILLTTFACDAATNTVDAAGSIPDPAVDTPLATAKSEQTAVIAGG